MASWYRPPDGKIEELELFKKQLEKVKTLHKGNKPPRPMSWVILTSEILIGQIDSQTRSEGAKLMELISDHELEQVVHFPTRGQDTLDLIITSLPGQFVDIHPPRQA